MKTRNRWFLGGILFIFALLAALIAFYPVNDQDTFTYVEGMEKDRIICRCSDGFFANSKCKTTNTGEICAMSEPGGNIKCKEYQSNCSKVRHFVKEVRSLAK